MSRKRLDQYGVKEPLVAGDYLIGLDSENTLLGFPMPCKVPADAIGGGTGPAQDRITVNATATVKEGVVYNTLTAAIAYLNTQSVGLDDPWKIKLEGDYIDETEEIVIPLGVSICGEGNNKLNVIVDTNTVSLTAGYADFNKTFQHGFYHLNFIGTIKPSAIPPGEEGTVHSISFNYCTFSGFMDNDGGFGGLEQTIVVFNTCGVFGGSFEKTMTVRSFNCAYTPLRGNIALKGFHTNASIIANDSTINGILLTGEYKNCHIQALLSFAPFTYCFSGDCKFWNCNIETGGELVACDGLESYDTTWANWSGFSNELNVSGENRWLFVGGSLNDFAAIVATPGNDELTTVNTYNVAINQSFTFVRSGALGQGRLYLQGINSLVTTVGTWDVLGREYCLWDDAPDTDSYNFYSAAKIHSLIP